MLYLIVYFSLYQISQFKYGFIVFLAYSLPNLSAGLKPFWAPSYALNIFLQQNLQIGIYFQKIYYAILTTHIIFTIMAESFYSCRKIFY